MSMSFVVILCMFIGGHFGLISSSSSICPEVYEEVAPHSLLVQFDHIEITSRSSPPTISTRTAKEKPKKLEWISDDNNNDNDYFSVLMVDPDAPSKANPKMAEWLHWLIVNIPDHGGNIDKGDKIMEYAGPTPPKNTGDHRYCIYVFKQQGGYDPNLKSLSFKRAKFNTNNFLNSDGADLELVAANYFYSNHEF